MNFLDLNKASDITVFDKVLNFEIDIQRCQFEDEETKCPMFELADEPMTESEKAGIHWCTAQRWESSKALIEIIHQQMNTVESHLSKEQKN